MKTKFFIVVLVLGLFSSSTILAQEKENLKTQQEHVSVTKYACPMHPEVKSDKPGDCSKCGMELKMDVKKEANKHCSMPKKGSCCPKKTDNPTTKKAKKSSCTRKKEKSKE